MAVKQSTAERFWTKARVGDPEQCWEWQASRTKVGYGKFTTRHQYWEGAHRIAWMLTVGPIPDGLSVLHRCDNPPCVNPGHLFLGTQTDNMADMNKKGRVAKGDRHKSRTKPESVARGEAVWMAKLTEDDVRAIRASAEIGRVLAARYGVQREAIDKIKRRERWKHVS